MAFLDELRRRFRQTPGYAGGTLEEQLFPSGDINAPRVPLNQGALAQSPNGQILTPQNQQPITRPRTVTPQPEVIEGKAAQPSFTDALKRRFQSQPQQEGFGSSDEPFGSTRQRRTQPRDMVADDAQYLRDLQNQPRGKKDIAMSIIDAVNAGFGNKPRTTLTKRERELQRAEQNLGLDVDLQKQALTQMVPVQLEDGTIVQTPARSAGPLQSQQQRIRQQNAEGARRKKMDEARVAHWGSMDTDRRKRLILSEYNSGALNSPELLEYAADELGLSGPIREKFIAGRMRGAIDENGNQIQINQQTGIATPVTTAEGVPQGSFAKTQLGAANTRAANAQAGANYRAGLRGTTGQGRKITAGERKDIAETAAIINQVHRQLTDIDAQIGEVNKRGNPSDPELPVLGRKRKELVAQGALQADKLNRIDPDNEWGSGEGGYPYSKPKVQMGGSDLDKPIYGKPVGNKLKLSEGTVRQAAIDAGLDPDEAVRRAKAKGRL